jgi:hypothetical protein
VKGRVGAVFFENRLVFVNGTHGDLGWVVQAGSTR